MGVGGQRSLALAAPLSSRACRCPPRFTLPAAILPPSDLEGNALAGSLPTRWGRLHALERLRLGGNALQGTLPAAWNNLDALRYLCAGWTGGTKGLAELWLLLRASCCRRKQRVRVSLKPPPTTQCLPLSYAHTHVPATPCPRRRARSNLASNRLSGELPLAWASLDAIYELDLSSNRLAGPLPAPWARLSLLARLALGGNGLSGGVPREWGRLHRLLVLDLGRNALTGGLPAEWGELRQATALDLSGNQLGGPLPPEWASLASLQVLALERNQLSGVRCHWRGGRRLLLGWVQLQLSGPAPGEHHRPSC